MKRKTTIAALAVLCLLLSGCENDKADSKPPGDGGQGGEGGSLSSEPSEGKAPLACERLFGLPNENTGLSIEQCSPLCETCDGNVSFAAEEYSANAIERLRQPIHRNAPSLLDSSPYDSPGLFAVEADKRCGIIFDADGSYELATYNSDAEADAAGATLTHHGACGACSSLQDLAVYIEEPDLTTPVRSCSIQNLNADAEELANCISGLGFTEACSQIWAFNSIHTRENCYDSCIAAIGEPYHLADGSPNDCIQCDEDTSGPVFKAVSGRTRRNSGLPTALCRPCQGIAPLSHDYVPN